MESVDIFSAISAAPRREILAMLSQREMPMLELAESFEMSVPAVSQHLAVLRNAGLVEVRKSGRQRIYSIQAEPLREVADWVGAYEKFWTDKLAALGEYLEDNK
jgi:DNA-binding transcriptional ArsR family regulator